MANDSSLGGERIPFDLNTQSEVMKLLAAVSASKLASAEKNELRDLVFSYSRGGQDPSVRQMLEQKVAEYGIIPVVSPNEEREAEAETAYPFGTSRPAPAFDPVAQNQKVAPTPTPTPSPQPVVEPVSKESTEAAAVPQPTPVVQPAAPTAPKPTEVQGDGFVPAVPDAPKEGAPPAGLPIADAPVTPQPPPSPPSVTQPPLADPVPPAIENAPAPTLETTIEKPATPETNSMVAPPTPASQPEAAAPATPVAPSTPPPIASESLQRIREIKAIVNEKVGNPVNLVDIDNEVGREYMSALLEAMKKVSSGTSTAAAMEKLESTLIKVEAAIEKHQKEGAPAAPVVPVSSPGGPQSPQPASTVSAAPQSPPAAQPPAPIPEPAPNPTPAPQKVKKAVPVSQTPPAPPNASTNDTAVHIPVSEPASSPMATPEQHSQPASPPVVPPAPHQAPSAQDPEPKASYAFDPVDIVAGEGGQESTPASPLTQPLQSPDAPKLESSPALASAEASVPVETGGEPAPISAQTEKKGTRIPLVSSVNVPQTVAENPPAPGEGKVISLADAEVKLHTPDDLPSASSIETATVEGDQLFTKEVDIGLDQLLTEWSLFKKSGIFGTGPKGREHPLFLKIKELQIPLLLAGRFEGATQEIKQSITDYMNGWRYEQGIIYEQGETFEHYLRRVIRHILDLQKNQ